MNDFIHKIAERCLHPAREDDPYRSNQTPRCVLERMFSSVTRGVGGRGLVSPAPFTEPFPQHQPHPKKKQQQANKQANEIEKKAQSI